MSVFLEYLSSVALKCQWDDNHLQPCVLVLTHHTHAYKPSLSMPPVFGAGFLTLWSFILQDLYRSYFDLPVVNSQSALNDPESAIFRFTWLLYLVGKSTLLPQFPDLVTCFNLLVCVFNSVLANMPLQHCTHKFSDVVRFPVRSPGGGADTLHSITRAHKASLAEVSPLMASLDKVMRDLFASRIPPAEAVAAAAGEPVSVYSATVFPGLLSNPVALSAAIEVLSASYNQSYIKSGEIDERPFVEREAEPNTAPAGATPPSMSRLQVGTPRRSVSCQCLYEFVTQRLAFALLLHVLKLRPPKLFLYVFLGAEPMRRSMVQGCQEGLVDY